MKLTSARVAVGVVALFGVSACEEGFGTNPLAEAQSQSSQEPRVEIREVERPDIFSTSENALWDGRPSLGGAWVAHPDVTTPESVLITNKANDRTIPGALFRRERENPGPRIQVSSDAAAQLGMLAGQPVELSIVVVRREEVEIAPAPLPISEENSDDATSEENTDSTDNSDSGAAEAAAAGVAAAEVANQPKKKGFWQKFKDSLKNEPKEEAVDETLEAETAETADVPDVETAPLDPVAATAAAAIAEAEAEDTKEDAKEEVAQPDPAPERSAPAGQLKNPFVQVGLFGVEANANAASANLRQAGVVPTVKQITNSEGKTLWRVLIGPVTSSDDQAEILALVKKLGYRDAFLSPN